MLFSGQRGRELGTINHWFDNPKVHIILGSRLPLPTCEAKLQQGANEYQMFPVCPGNESQGYSHVGCCSRKFFLPPPGEIT